MRVFRGLEHLPSFKHPVITIGTFDGVHSGHAKIIERLRKRAADVDGESIIITFDPHPRLVISSEDKGVELLTSLNEKIRDLEEMKVDNLVVVPFTKSFSEISAQTYIREFIVSHFHPHTLVIGYDHHFGKNRTGNYELLESVKDEFGFLLEEIPAKEIEHSAVSSTKIRRALYEGDIRKANELLGRPYLLEGIVIHGEQRGRLIGYPTANIEVEDRLKLIPANGVYAVNVYINKLARKGMMNIGVRPTISQNLERSIEVHIFDFDQTIYNEKIRVELIDRLREEKKFNGIEELVAQLKRDENEARELLRG